MDENDVDVVGIGAVTWDRFLVVPWHPEPNEKVRAIQTEESAGGMTATALVALRRWGMACRFVGVVGYDEYSDLIVDDLSKERIDIRYLVRDPDADGRRTTVLVDNRNGNRCIISGPHRVPPLTPDQIKPEIFEGARVLHLDSTVDECCLEAAAAAREAGLFVTLDIERLCKRTMHLMRAADIVIVPLHLASECTGQTNAGRAAYALHLQTERAVVVTDGRNGCEYVDKDMAFQQPAFDVPVVDSTGAGDVFHAGYIYGLLAAWEPKRIVRFASWVAACTCKELGSRKGIPPYEAVHRFLHSDIDID